MTSQLYTILQSNYFYNGYSIKDKTEMEDSCNSMKQLWNPSEGFEVLRKRFDNGIICASFADNAVTAGDSLNMLMNVIIKTDVFQTQYEELHSLPKNDQTLKNALRWWSKKVRFKNKFDKLAGNMGTGNQYEMVSQQ